MEYKILRTKSEFEEIKDAWAEIEKEAPYCTYFSSYRYNHDWWAQYDSDPSVELFIIVVIHNQGVVGIAPLQKRLIRSRFHKYVELQFIHGGGDYSDFLVHPNVSAEPSKIVNEMLAQITSHQSEYDVVNLTHINSNTLLAHQILISKNNQSLQYLIECPYIDFSKYTDFETYTKAFIPKKIKQYINRFGREVDYRIEVTSRNVVDDISKIHIAEKEYLQSKGFEQRHSFFENQRELTFRKELYNENNAVLTYLLIDNKTEDIICYYTGYVFRGVFHSVTTAYNPKYASLAVGKIFNYMIFQENYSHPRWNVFDMGTGRYSWKFEMTDNFNLLYQYRYECYRKSWQNALNKLEKVLSNTSHVLKG